MNTEPKGEIPQTFRNYLVTRMLKMAGCFEKFLPIQLHCCYKVTFERVRNLVRKKVRRKKSAGWNDDDDDDVQLTCLLYYVPPRVLLRLLHVRVQRARRAYDVRTMPFLLAPGARYVYVGELLVRGQEQAELQLKGMTSNCSYLLVGTTNLARKRNE